MSAPREGVNPLRPYYIPPSIGEPAGGVAAPSADPYGGRHAANNVGYASRARDAFADLDYKDYLGDSSPSVIRAVQEFVDDLVWKYTSVLMAQPFEVAKTILQVRDQDENAAISSLSDLESPRRKTSSYGGSIYDVSIFQMCHGQNCMC